MTTLFELAIETARLLPPEKQDEIARLVLEMAAEEQSPYVLSDEEQSEIADALGEVERGELVDESAVRGLLSKFTR